MSLSGSDTNGGCPEECVAIVNNFNVCQCSGNTPTNSTLIDGVCPTSVDTTEPDWASGFFAISRNRETQIRIGFNWENGFMLRGVELKLFNCAPLNTDIRTINVWGSVTYPTLNPTSLVGSYVTNGDDLNCNSVTTIVIPTEATLKFPTYYIYFEFLEGDSNTGIYIAEARFSDTTITIPNEVTSSPPPPAVTSKITSVPVLMMSSLDTTLYSSPVTSVMIAPIRTISSNRLSSTVQLIPTPTTTPIGFTDPPTVTVPPTTDPLPASSDPQLGAIVGSLVGVIVVLVLIIVIVTVTWWRQKRNGQWNRPEGNIQTNDLTNHSLTINSENIDLKTNQAYENIEHGDTAVTDANLVTNPSYDSVPPPPTQRSVEYDYIPDLLHGSMPPSNSGEGTEDCSCRPTSVVYEEIPS